MHFDCPCCQQRLEIENDRVGEYLPCPSCERTIRVPRAPVVIHKGGGRRSVNSTTGNITSVIPTVGSLRLVKVPPSARRLRPGSLEERVAALKSAMNPEEPRLL